MTRPLAQDPQNVASKLSAWSKAVCFTPRCLSPLCGDLGLPLPTGLPTVPSTQSQRDARGWARRGDAWARMEMACVGTMLTKSVCCCGFSNGIHRCVPEGTGSRERREDSSGQEQRTREGAGDRGGAHPPSGGGRSAGLEGLGRRWQSGSGSHGVGHPGCRCLHGETTGPLATGSCSPTPTARSFPMQSQGR